MFDTVPNMALIKYEKQEQEFQKHKTRTCA